MLTKEQLLKGHTKVIDISIGKIEIGKFKVGDMIDTEGKEIDIYKALSNAIISPLISTEELKQLDGDIFQEIQKEVMDFSGIDAVKKS